MREFLFMVGMWIMGAVVGVAATMTYYDNYPIEPGVASVENPAAVYGDLQLHKMVLLDMTEVQVSYRLRVDTKDARSLKREACLWNIIAETLSLWPLDFILERPGLVNAVIADKSASECYYRANVIVELTAAERVRLDLNQYSEAEEWKEDVRRARQNGVDMNQFFNRLEEKEKK